MNHPDNTLAVVAVITTGVAGLGAAFIAAFFARSRQNADLAASQLRLQTQLIHERALSDITELRTLLDRIIEDLNTAIAALIAAAVAASTPIDSKKVLDLTDQADAPNHRLYASVRHLMFRLGRTHPCPTQLNEVSGALSTWSTELAKAALDEEPLDPEEADRLREDLITNAADFIDVVVPLAGSQT
jgi:hypothetical protein